MLNIRTISRALFLILGLLTLNVFAAEGQQDVKAALEQRVTEYWAARQSRDTRTLYEMESAARPGGWLTPDKAGAVSGLPVRNVKLEEITLDGERASVRLNADVMVGTMGWWKQTLEDAWVFIDGQWYHDTKQ